MKEQRVGIIGIGAVPARSASPDVSYREMIFEAAQKAYYEAGIEPEQVDTFVCLSEDFNEGVSIFDEYVPDQLGAVLKPVHTICGDGLYGIASVFMQIRTGVFQIGVVEAHSKLSNIVIRGKIEEMGLEPLYTRWTGLHPYFIAGLEMRRFLYETGIKEEDCAEVVRRFRENAIFNPLAAYPSRISTEDVLNSRKIATPLKELDIAPQADGAVVLVLAREDAVRSLKRDAVWIEGISFFTGEPHIDSRDFGRASYAELSARKALEMAGIKNIRKEVKLAEICDVFSYKALQHIEAIGLAKKGESGMLLREGFFDFNGEIPVNLSGGYMGIGAMFEATVLYQVLEVVKQLRGEAGNRQVKNAKVGIVQSWRGIPTSSGATLILGV